MRRRDCARKLHLIPYSMRRVRLEKSIKVIVCTRKLPLQVCLTWISFITIIYTTLATFAWNKFKCT